MKNLLRPLGGASLLAPLAIVAACVAPVQTSGDPWSTTGEEAETADPWPWGAEGVAQPTHGQLDPQESADASGAETTLPDRTEPPLLSWDGGVVDGPPPGSVTEVAGSRRDLGKPGDRWHIIELYQAALKERDELADEVSTLSAALERAYALLDQSEKNGLALTSEVGTAKDELARLRQENDELAARLATAQIRRLEAEKMLLETRIEAHRQREAKSGKVAMGDGK